MIDPPLHRSNFVRNKWYKKYQKDGFVGILGDKREGTARVMTPTTKKECNRLAGKGMSANEVKANLRPFWDDRGETDRELPHRRTVTKELAKTHTFVRKTGRLFVKAPWTARWRRQFAAVVAGWLGRSQPR